MKSKTATLLDEPVKKFYERWVTANKQNSTKYWMDGNLLPAYVKQSYDCVQLLARGLYAVMNKSLVFEIVI
jgi:hypothetical protein